jgi:chromosomal replication initiator protein
MNQPPTLPPDHASSSLDAGSSFNTGESSEGATGEKRWELCLGVIRSQLDPQIYAAYLKPLRFVSFDVGASVLMLSVPSRLVLNHIEQNYREALERVAREFFGAGGQLTVRIELDSKRAELLSAQHQLQRTVKVQRPQIIPPPVGPNSPGDSSRTADTNRDFSNRECAATINPRYTFENFVVGNSNQFCHAAAIRCAEEPGKSYNPLFIYGGVGLGKTHLLHAIGNAVLQRRPNAKVLYLSSETFTNELIQALRNAKMDEFKTRLRGVEVLLIDDIQFIVGKERTQEEFFHTFNALYSAHHQIVITSDKVPQEIPGIEERLQTRFSWGLTADLQAPDFETRVAIINRKTSSDGLVLSEEVAHFIAEKVSSNVRELEGALTRLHAISSLQGCAMSMELAKNALKPFLQRKAVNVTSDDIKKAVAQHFGVKVSEMISKRRTKSISFPRHIAMYLCRKHTTLSYPEIGGEFGGRDHSSVIHAAQVVSSKLSSDSAVKNLIGEIERSLLG